MGECTSVNGKPRVLCVDDEDHVLAGLRLSLRRHYEVETAVGGHAALELIAKSEPFTVIISDMRMPGMSGTQLLSRVRELAPDTVRVLLTGCAELEAAIQAVNECQLFRFLTKPCNRGELLGVMEAAGEQHRLLTAERVLLEQTLRGTIDAMTEILAQTNPAAFGRATRVRRHVGALCDIEGISDRWHVEVAAMLSQLGAVSLPPQVAEKLDKGRPLEQDEQEMVERVPLFTSELLARIPRLEAVRSVLERSLGLSDEGTAPRAGAGDEWEQAGQILRIALDYDELDRNNRSPHEIATVLSGRSLYDKGMLSRFIASVIESANLRVVREIALKHLVSGMVIAEEVYTPTGVPVVARDQELTPSILERLRNFSLGVGIQEPIRIYSQGATSQEPPLAAVG